MYQIHVRSGFSSGHALRGYNGKCEHQHGHNYKVRVSLAGEKLDDCGMLIDFKVIKGMLNNVIDRLDHENLNELPAFTSINPSAENLARHIYEGLESQLKESQAGARLRNVTVWETDRNAVSYSE